MAKAQIILGELGGGNQSVVEGHIMIRTATTAGMQIAFNDTTNIQQSTSTDWTGNYISFNNSTGNITALQDCRASYKVNNDNIVTADYKAGDTIVNSGFGTVSVGYNIQTYVLA